MNIEQLKKYPKALLRFDEWLSEKYLHVNHETNEIWVQATETAPSRRFNNYEISGLLTEFFDEQGIYLLPFLDVSDKNGLGFDHDIKNKSNNYLTMLFCGGKTRQESFERAIEKCFEILEQL